MFVRSSSNRCKGLGSLDKKLSTLDSLQMETRIRWLSAFLVGIGCQAGWLLLHTGSNRTAPCNYLVSAAQHQQYDLAHKTPQAMAHSGRPNVRQILAFEIRWSWAQCLHVACWILRCGALTCLCGQTLLCGSVSSQD